MSINATVNAVQYQAAARKTAIYPSDVAVLYPAFGLVDEAEELDEKVQADADRPDLIKELGDVLWYVAGLATDLRFSLEGLFVQAAEPDKYDPFSFTPTSNSLTEWTTVLFRPTADPYSATALAAALLRRAAKVCGRIKKWLRDSDRQHNNAQILAVWKKLADVLPVAAALAVVLGSDLGQVAVLNIHKLAERQNAGTLQGSGDNR